MRSIVLVLFLLVLAPLMYGVTYTINPNGGDYTSFSAAIDYVNGLAFIPVGGIEFLVPGNLTFTELPDTLTALASEASPLVIRKFGLGANPKILNDNCPNTRGVIMIANSSWITFDGIDIVDPVVSDANRYATGYYIQQSSHVTIKNAHVLNFSDTGINVRLASTYITLLHNTISHSADYFSSVTTINGINVSYNASADQVYIEKNTITGLKLAASTLYGIHLGQINGRIVNNFISLQADNNDKIYAIRADSRAGKTIEIDFNTVLIGGVALDHGYALATFGGDATSTFKIRNNVLLNTRSGFDQYSTYLGLISPTYVMDYNIYYSGDEVNTFLGRWFQSDINSFANWQQTSAMDAHSKVKNLTFVNAPTGDLHLSGSSIGDVDLAGLPIAAITDDIDSETRYAVRPYRGADENLQTPLNISVVYEPTSLDFGIVPVGTSPVLPLVVRNSGALAISIESLFTETPFSLRFLDGTWSQALTGFNLLAGETRTVEVKYTPTGVEVNSVILQIVTNVTGSEICSFPLTGTGGAPEISITQASLSFGNFLTGQATAPQMLNIQNIGNFTLQLSSVTCPTGFEIRYPSTSSWTNMLSNLDILQNQVLNIEVRFVPTEEITYNGVITVVSNDLDEATTGVPVSGTGVALSPPLNLVAIAGNQQVTLNWEVPLGSTREGRPLSAYRVYRNTALLTETTSTNLLDTGVENTFLYTYYVTAVYIEPAGESAPSNSVTVTPINPIPVIAVEPISIDFGRVPRNSISDTLSVLISNNGWVNLQLGSLSTSAPFSISSDQINWNTQLTTLVVEPGTNIHLYVRCMPTTISDLASSITMTTNDALHPTYQIGLAGVCTGIALTLLPNVFEGTYLSEGAWGDYDNDNDLDLLYTGYGLTASAGTIYLYRDDNGQFTEVATNMTGVGNSMTNWVDFDRDGDLDIFVSGQYQFENNFCGLYRNDNGLFNLVDTGIIPLVSGSSEWGDFDNDGDPDLLMTGDELVLNGTDTPHADIYRNDGSGVFTLVTNTGLSPVGNADAKFCDWDNDGDLDIALSGSAASFQYITKIYRNDGTLPFIEVYSPTVGLRYSDLAWGDNDNDGDSDLIVTGSYVNEANSITRIYRNDGNSAFTEIDPGIPGIRQGDIIWTDLDNDGLLDVFMNGVFNNQQWIGYGYLNLGSQYAYADSVESLKYTNIVPGDYDNDGDIDFFQSGRYDFQDYRNTIFRNDNPNVQTPPSSPLDLSVTTDTSLVVLSWTPGSDLETPEQGLTYNLFVGHSANSDEHYTAMANLATGFRKIPASGNMGQKTSFTMRLPNGNYFWGVQTIDNSLKGSSFAQGTPFTVSGVGNIDITIPTVITGLGSIYPNPFNPETNISYSLSNAGQVRIDIFNLRGQLVKTLEKGMQPAGNHVITWNGTDASGVSVGSGIYFCRFNGGNVQTIKKLSLVK